MAMRFLLDLGDRVERLDKDGLGTCAVELFERPWVVTHGAVATTSTSASDAAGSDSSLEQLMMSSAMAVAAARARRQSASAMFWPEQPRPLLQLQPRPDGLAKRVVAAVLSPIVAPIGAAVAYFKSGRLRANGAAACKWYFRAVTEVPCHVRLDQSYRVDEGIRDMEELVEAAHTEEGPRRLVHGSVPQLVV